MMMSERLRKSVLALVTATILCQLIVASISPAASASFARIDVFTQKKPYSGRGHNMQSDAFGPQDVVLLHAEVWTDNYTVDNILVAFNVETPSGANFSISARTNSSGIATVNFTIATPPINISENDVFGYWKVIGTLLYAGQVFSDRLIFRVDWIVKLLTVRTINENLTNQDSFGNGGDVGFEITLRSIARILTNATISVVVKDELDFTVNFSLIQDFAVQPNEKLLFIYSKATLPKGAHIGGARVYVSAFTKPVSDGGVSFCPAIHADFQIVPTNPLAIDLHDVAAVAVLPSANPIEIGQDLELTTLVRNEGTVPESFAVSTYFDGVLLGTAFVTALAPYATKTFSYTINPSVLTLGNHTVSANIPLLPKEADPTDNNFNDIVEVITQLPTVPHDIAVTSVTISQTVISIGETVGIGVTVFNKGNESETFDLNVYYNSSLIETIGVEVLLPLEEQTFTFNWNTNTVTPGSYQISASAPLPGDANPSDNTFVDGTVQIKSGPPPENVYDVAVLNVVPSPSIVEAGQIVSINVTVKNKGSVTESFYVSLYYDHIQIDTKHVLNLAPSKEIQIMFTWNTTGVFPLKYVISAVADTVEGETRTADNTFVDGTVTILPYPPFFPTLDWLVFSIIVVIATIAGIILLFLLFALERIRRRRTRPVYTVIAHPHI
jgi:hypothetical protein